MFQFWHEILMMHRGGIYLKHQCIIFVKRRFFGLNFFFFNVTLFLCMQFIGTLVLLDKNASASFCFGAIFYDAPVQKSGEAPVSYSNRTPWMCVYVAQAVRCANVSCTPVRSMVGRTPVIESLEALEN